MFTCPRCKIPLHSAAGPRGRYLCCERCSGRSATVGLLRKALKREEINRVWGAIERGERPAQRDCPSCRSPMQAVSIGLPGGPVELDGCRSCQRVWFDGGEFDRFTPRSPEQVVKPELPDEARRMLAQVELTRFDRSRERDEELQGVDEGWKLVPGILGLPVEAESHGHGIVPLATWGLSALILVLSLLVLSMHDGLSQFGWIPAETARMGGLPLLSSFFVHADTWHLLGNLYFLIVFGNSVESLLGGARYLVLILVAHLAGLVGHLLLVPPDDMIRPLVGASAGISGVLAYYACRLPHARIGLLAIYAYRASWLRLPAWGAFVLWLLLQFYLAIEQNQGLGSVSAGGHLGGALVGLLLGFGARRRSDRRHAEASKISR